MRILIGVIGCMALLPQAIANERSAAGDSREVQVTADTFRCVTEMTPVRHFFVDNLLGNLEGTLEIANSEDGGVYPPGSVIPLVPTEVMVKHGEGWNAPTRDWEFFELDVSTEGSSIRNRGFVDVINRFGGNCFACHIKARAEWDLICKRIMAANRYRLRPSRFSSFNRPTRAAPQTSSRKAATRPDQLVFACAGVIAESDYRSLISVVCF